MQETTVERISEIGSSIRSPRVREIAQPLRRGQSVASSRSNPDPGKVGKTRMSGSRIAKDPTQMRVLPNLLDYETARRDFTWESVRRELEGLPSGAGINIAHEAVDRHAAGALAHKVAFRFLRLGGSIQETTYAGLRRETNRFAHVLRRLGVETGERVFALSGRVPELYVTALAALKNKNVFCPLFAAFGPEPIFQRLSRGDARVLVTDRRLYEKKIRPLRGRLDSLRQVILIDGEESGEETLSFREEMSRSSEDFTIPKTDPGDMALIHFTSGTTGMPKGAVHVHEAVVTHLATARYALDLHPEDVFWCTADPGWVTGTSYGIIAPLLMGVTAIVDEGDFEAERWYRILEEQRVTVWYTAPTAVRLLMRFGGDPKAQYDLSSLRFIASVGEPLNPEAVLWGLRALGLPIHDNWWQTETGGILIANFAAMDICPGSMGKPLPGIDAAIVNRTEEGVELLSRPGVSGDLAIRSGWPSMFRGYLHEEERYRKCFRGDWYLTGDLAMKDEDGYFHFVGRADDIIKTSGHMVGPFEVESALMEHPQVAEAGVIGKPDPTIGQLVKAFVVLKPPAQGTEELRLSILGFARKKLGSAVAPKEIDFVPDLPKTRSGKIMRRLLKARELGLEEGDTSTLMGEER
jgi:acetyl-CoA synthetase